MAYDAVPVPGGCVASIASTLSSTYGVPEIVVKEVLKQHSSCCKHLAALHTSTGEQDAGMQQQPCTVCRVTLPCAMAVREQQLTVVELNEMREKAYEFKQQP